MHRSARFALLLLGLAAACAVAGCGDGDESTAVTETKVESSAGGGADRESILIKTHVRIEIPSGGPVEGGAIGGGEVLGGSKLGDSAFCRGGTFSDQHGEDPVIGLVMRSFDCPEGTLKIGFTPEPPTTPRTQEGPWRSVRGTGAFEDLRGDGRMEVEYDPGTDASEGSETFTGTVTH